MCRSVVFCCRLNVVLEGGDVLPSQEAHVACICICNLLGMGFYLTGVLLHE